MNALEARELSIKNFKNNDILNSAIEQIKDACNNGLFSCEIYFEQDEKEDTIKYLKSDLRSLKYHVESILKEPEFEKENGKQYTFTMIRGIHVSWS